MLDSANTIRKRTDNSNLEITLTNNAGNYTADNPLETFTVGAGGKLLVKTDSSNYSVLLGIRPKIEAKKITASPGDDLQLQFSVGYANADESDGTIENTFVAEVVEENYIAVYDKKMLWRANLYIDEGAGEDWNNIHPWNAPASDAVYTAMNKSDQDKISWWKADWGYNQWNKTITTNGYDSDIVLGTPEKKISGKQVVVFSDFSWTPVRYKTHVGKVTNV